jgi:hypothetical protein
MIIDTTAFKEVESMLDSLEVLQCKVEAIPDNLTDEHPDCIAAGFTGESTRTNLLKVIRQARINCASMFYFYMSTFALNPEFDLKKHQVLMDRMKKMEATF